MKIKDQAVHLSQKAKEKIIEYIEQNHIQADEKLPSELELQKMLGVSRYTVREALTLLEQERIIYKIQGKGTYVTKRFIQIESGLEKLESTTEIISSFGYGPGTVWLDVSLEEPTPDMIKKLKLSQTDKVITFTRIRKANDDIAAFCIDTVPAQLLNNHIPQMDNVQSMFKFLKDSFNIEIQYAVTEIIPSLPTQEMLKELCIDKNKLFLLLHQIHFDKEGRPLIYSRDYFNSEIFRFKINRLK